MSRETEDKAQREKLGMEPTVPATEVKSGLPDFASERSMPEADGGGRSMAWVIVALVVGVAAVFWWLSPKSAPPAPPPSPSPAATKPVVARPAAPPAPAAPVPAPRAPAPTAPAPTVAAARPSAPPAHKRGHKHHKKAKTKEVKLPRLPSPPPAD